MSNMPTIYGDGKNDDAPGFSALFHNDPVIFKKDQLGIDSHKGIIFHKGYFIVKTPIHMPKNCKISIENFDKNGIPSRIVFVGITLESDQPIFECEDGSGTQFNNSHWIAFDVSDKHKGKLIRAGEHLKGYKPYKNINLDAVKI
jgi:hypothetical protein